MSVVKAAFTVGSFTLLSRVFGYIRECVMAAVIGPTMYSDALILAFRISSTFRRIFAEGALNSAFLPRFLRYHQIEGDQKANYVLQKTLSSMVIIVTCFVACMMFWFPEILKIIASGFEEESIRFKLTVDLGRICMPFLLFISISSIFSAVLNSVNKFAIPAASSVILNIFMIFAFLFGNFCDYSHHKMVFFAAVAILLSSIVQAYILYVNVKKHGFKINFSINCFSPEVRDILYNTVPGIIGAGVWQLNMFIDTWICSFFQNGTISILNAAERINQFPLGTIGISLGTALLPTLSQLVSNGDIKSLNKEIENSAIFSLFLIIPCAVLMCAISEPIVAVAFQRGLFLEEHVKITALAVEAFGIGLPAYALTKMFSSVFFAFGNTKTPVRLASFSIIFNIIFIALIVPFCGIFGIALSASLSSIIYSCVLILICKKMYDIKMTVFFFKRICPQIIAGIFMYISCIFMKNMLWNPTFGDSYIKYVILVCISCTSICLFIIITGIAMFFICDKKWKIWQRDTWIV